MVTNHPGQTHRPTRNFSNGLEGGAHSHGPVSGKRVTLETTRGEELHNGIFQPGKIRLKKKRREGSVQKEISEEARPVVPPVNCVWEKKVGRTLIAHAG